MIWLYIIILMLIAVLSGYIVSLMTKDEMKVGRKWFGLIVILSLILGFVFLFYALIVEALTMFFICLFSLVSWVNGGSFIRGKYKRQG